MSKCGLCPRGCEIDSSSGQKGFCGRGQGLSIARAALHFWEEPCISGSKGSGTVFFCGCNLQCVFCQNYAIAHRKPECLGPKTLAFARISAEELAEHFLRLQEEGANNINLVTPDHYIPEIIRALKLSKDQGLCLPIVYNTSSYVNLSSLRALEGLVDVYLADLKYLDPKLARDLCKAVDYPQVAWQAINEMVRQTKSFSWARENAFGPAVAVDLSKASSDFDPIDEGLLMTRGTIVRHLLFPGHTDDSRRVISKLYETFGNQIYLSIMNQYTPLREISGYPELSGKVSEEEYESLLDFALDLGLSQGFFQDGDVASESFIPEF